MMQFVYGCLLGNFILNAWRRLMRPNERRWALVAEHIGCNACTLVGLYGDRVRLGNAVDEVRRSIFFTDAVYDLTMRYDRKAFHELELTPFEKLYPNERDDLRQARLC